MENIIFSLSCITLYIFFYFLAKLIFKDFKKIYSSGGWIILSVFAFIGGIQISLIILDVFFIKISEHF